MNSGSRLEHSCWPNKNCSWVLLALSAYAPPCDLSWTSESRHCNVWSCILIHNYTRTPYPWFSQCHNMSLSCNADTFQVRYRCFLSLKDTNMDAWSAHWIASCWYSDSPVLSRNFHSNRRRLQLRLQFLVAWFRSIHCHLSIDFSLHNESDIGIHRKIDKSEPPSTSWSSVKI